MWRLRRFFLKLYHSFRSEAAEGDLAREVASHLTLLEDRFRRRGMTVDEAHLAARRAYGGIEQAKELQRNERSFTFVEHIRQDFRYAFRQARKNPGLVALITVVLALGIGANTTVFSLVRAGAHMPIRDPLRVVLFWSANQSRGLDRSLISPGDFADLKSSLRTVEDVAASIGGPAHLMGAAEPLRLSALRVTANYFSVLGIAPAIGRDFVAEDSESEQAVVILAHATWQNYFGGEPEILGRRVEINGIPHEVIGLMAPEFVFLSSDELWLPMRIPTAFDDRTARRLIVVGRLNPDATLEQAQSEASILSEQLVERHPDTEVGWEITVTGAAPMRPDEIIVSSPIIGVPFLVLGIACANIANLLLAQGLRRKREIAVRVALGASRSRIVRLLLIESVVYAMIGAGCGVLLGSLGTDLIVSLNLTPFWSRARVDMWVLAASIGAGLFSVLLFGLAPALGTARVDHNDALKQGSANTTIDRKSQRLRKGLVIGEVAAATLLLLVAGLMLRSATALRAIETGFNVDGVLTFRTDLQGYRYAELSDAARVHLGMLDSLRGLPGVMFAGAGTRVPIEGNRNNPTEQLVIEDREYPDPGERDWSVDLTVTPGYFEALGVPLLEGRYFGPRDTASSLPVAVVGLSTAQKYWGREEAIGRRIRMGDLGSRAPWVTIVGIVGDVRNDDADAPPLPTIYFPLGQRPARALTYVVQTTQNPGSASEAIRRAVTIREPGLPIYRLRTMEQLLWDDLEGVYIVVGLFGVFGLIALSLTALGIFGVLSHVTSESRPELAIRTALGANPNEIVYQFVWKGLRLAIVGIVMAVFAGIGLVQIIQNALYGVGPVDPFAFGLAITVLLTVAVLACYFPARRAARTDPMTVLRSD